MSYNKHNFQSGDKLYASQLNEMDEQIASNSIDLEQAVHFQRGVNLLNTATTSDGIFVDKYSSVNDLDSIYTSDFIDVQFGKTYYCRPSYQQQIPMYNERKQYIGYIGDSPTNVFTISNPQARYVRIIGYMTDKATDMFAEGAYPSSYNIYFYN